MVGAGKLIQLLFGMPYMYSIIAVGAVMMVYVPFGGMLATTWVQIIKACLLLGGASLMAVLVLSRFGFNPLALFAEAARISNHPAVAAVAGTAAQQAVNVSGPGPLVAKPAPMLAGVLGGEPLLGFIAAVAFATILAVVAGLTLSGASALSHDLWVNVVRHGEAPESEQLTVARYATLFFGVAAVALGLAFETTNVAYMVGLAFAIAASANFPALFLSIFWRRFTTAGACASMWVGTLTAVALIVLCPSVWVDILHHKAAVFPLKSPGIVSIPLSFIVAVAVSLMGRETGAEEKFEEVRRRIGSGGATF